MRDIKGGITPVFMTVYFLKVTKKGLRQVHKSLLHLRSEAKQVCFCKVQRRHNILFGWHHVLPIGFWSVLSVYTDRLTLTIFLVLANRLNETQKEMGFLPSSKDRAPAQE